LIAATAVALTVAAAAAAHAAPAKDVIGHSRQGRPIVARELGDPSASRTVLVVGSIHGDETQGRRVVERLRRHSRRLRRAQLWTIETVNPDGVAAGTRGNARGVDLNRNFAAGWRSIPPSSGYYSGPHAFSEPETRAVRRFLRRLRPDVTIWYHQPFGRTLIPCERRGRRVAQRYARLSGLLARDCYPTPPGAATGWQDDALRKKAFVAEFGPGPLSRSQVRRHARAVLEIAGR
jgi:murein peptide amidase A